MSDLSPEARALLDAARAHDRLAPADRRRLRAAIAAQVAVAAGAGVAASASTAQAASVAPGALSAGLEAQTAAKLTWSLASLSTTKGVAVMAAVAALSTTATVTQHLRTRASSPRPTTAAPHVVTTAPRALAAHATAQAAKDPTVTETVVTTHIAAPAAVTVTVSTTSREAPRDTPRPAPPRAAPSIAEAPTVEPPIAAPAPHALEAWECAREIDRALLRDDSAGALVWVDRCRAQLDGPQGAMLGTRAVMALCAEGRADEATAIARRVLLVDGSAMSQRRIERTCARGALRGAP